MDDSKVLKASFWYTVCNFILNGFSLITTPIFSRILTQEEYGYATNFSSWLSIMMIVATLSLDASLLRARFIYKEQLKDYVRTILLAGSIITLGIAVIILGNYNWFSGIFSMDWKYMFILFLSIIFDPAYTMFMNLERFEFRYKSVVFISICSTVANLGMSLLFVYTFEDKLWGRILGGQLPQILIAVVLYAYLLGTSKGVRLEYFKFAIKISLPYTFHLIAGTLLNTSDRVMITNLCGAESTALYSIPYNIAAIVSILWSSMNEAYSPWLAEMLSEKKYENIKKYSYGYILVFSYIILGFMLVAPEGLLILGGESYLKAQYVIPPVMIGYFFLFMYSIYVNIEQYMGKTVGMAIGTTVAGGLNILLNYLLLPRFGYIAGAYTTAICYLALFVFHFLLVRRVKLHRVYNTAFVWGTAGVMVVIALLILKLYDWIWLRYILVVIYAVTFFVLVYKNKEQIIQKLKKQN